jgi:Rhs element Vgr protein
MSKLVQNIQSSGVSAFPKTEAVPGILGKRGSASGSPLSTGGFAGPLESPISLKGPVAGGVAAGVSTGGFSGPLGGIANAGGGGGGGTPPDANREWFTFACQKESFSVYSFTGTEEICRPYEFSIELVSLSASEDLTSLLGTPGCLSIADRSGGIRKMHGLIRNMEQLHTANRYTHYRCVVVPKLWFLGQITDHRIFQRKSVVDILSLILQEQGFTGEDFEFKIGGTYDPRNYCVQYGENTLHFITRLCEEEGIFFYFEHTDASHKLCFSDQAGGPMISGESSIRFFPGSGQRQDTSVISRLTFQKGVNSNAAAFRDWNFSRPKLDLNIEDREEDPQKAPVPPNMHLEQYRFPHFYDLQKSGKRYVKLQLERQLTFAQSISCRSDISRFLPSFTFDLHSHPRQEINDTWWISGVYHHGEQPGVLQHEAPDGRGHFYESTVVAIPAKTRFIPALDHAKPRIVGSQVAIVTGPPGEDIYPDKHGRVKVQFFWDREGQWDDDTSCWIRVAQGASSGQFGSIAIPRIGDEVVVSFLEGDPDRPLITGRVFNEMNQPPQGLPGNKTQTGFKSYSSPQSGGFNEFRVEDKAGQEEMFMRTEKDMNVFVKNDWSDQIIADRHQLTGRHTFTRTIGETHRMLEKNRITLLGETDYTVVTTDSILLVQDRDISQSGKETQIASTGVICIAAEQGITLCCGKSVITLTPENISIDSPDIWLNCAFQDPVKITEFEEMTPAPPKGASAGSSPNGGNMPQPMASRTGKPDRSKPFPPPMNPPHPAGLPMDPGLKNNMAFPDGMPVAPLDLPPAPTFVPQIAEKVMAEGVGAAASMAQAAASIEQAVADGRQAIVDTGQAVMDAAKQAVMNEAQRAGAGIMNQLPNTVIRAPDLTTGISGVHTPLIPPKTTK